MDFEKHVRVGDIVKIHFNGRLEDGSEFESSFGKDPLRFTVGNNDVLAGIDDAVIGMKVNQEKTVNVNSDMAYGSIEKELIIRLDKKDFPDKLDVKLGQELQIPNEDGNPFRVFVTDITENEIELDGNHPLAGKNLIFNLKLVDIE